MNDEEGIKAIIYLKAIEGEVETPEQAQAGWAAMNDIQRNHALKLCLSYVMRDLIALLSMIPVTYLRHLVATGESIAGQVKERLPSGKSFDQHTVKARLVLDFIDDLAQHEERVKKGEYDKGN